MTGAAEYRQPSFQHIAGATDLLLVRHGESAAFTDGQAFPLVGGHGDPELHPVGEQQAELVGERLAREDIAAIYVTTLTRTAQTAAPLAKRLGIEPLVEPDLREVYLGEWEGGSYRKHVAERHPLALRVLAEGSWDAIPGAEPSVQFSQRVRGAVDRIASAHPDQCVAVFTHGGVIGQLMALATGGRQFAFLTDNASITHLVVSGDRWILRRYNDTAHLQPTFAAPR